MSLSTLLVSTPSLEVSRLIPELSGWGLLECNTKKACLSTFDSRESLMDSEEPDKESLLKSGLQRLTICMSTECSIFTFYLASLGAVSIVTSLWQFKCVHCRKINEKMSHSPLFRKTHFSLNELTLLVRPNQHKL